METYKIGDFIQITKSVRLHIEDIDVEIEDGEITVFFMCYETHVNGTASKTRPYQQFEIEKHLKK